MKTLFTIAVTLNVKKNPQYVELIPLKTQKSKDIHITNQAEIMNIYSLQPPDFKMCLEFFLVSLIFVNYYDIEARCAFLTNARFFNKNIEYLTT